MSLFVTGTDTGCGKTRVSCALLQAFAAAGHSVAGMKPIATGAVSVGGTLVNEDVEALIAASNVSLPRADINPYLFEPPCSPHIAAAGAGATIDAEVIAAALRRCAANADHVVVEGVGGWCVPAAPDLWLEHIVQRLQLPVLLVVGIRLGCINHGVLTARAVAAARLPLLGWIANIVDPTIFALDEVIASLSASIDAPRLAVLEWAPTATASALAPQLAPVVRAVVASARDQ